MNIQDFQDIKESRNLKTQWALEQIIQDLVLNDPQSKKARTFEDGVQLVKKHLGKKFSIGNQVITFEDDESVINSVVMSLMCNEG